MQFKNKIFIILFLFILISFTICSNVFASSSYVFSDGNTYSFPDFTLDDNCNYLLYINLNDNTSTVAMYSTDYTLKKNQQGTSYYLNLYDSNNNKVEGNNIHILKFNLSGSLTDDKYSGGIGIHDYIVYSSNVSIYDTEGSLVFQAAPSAQVIIPAIQQVKEIPQAMEQVLTILIPIGLIVLSIGLVIYLTRLVISRAQ